MITADNIRTATVIAEMRTSHAICLMSVEDRLIAMELVYTLHTLSLV
jgi:hypothetical protein